jgi:hypothetical protein
MSNLEHPATKHFCSKVVSDPDIKNAPRPMTSHPGRDAAENHGLPDQLKQTSL